MLIGGLIGLAFYSVIALISMAYVQAEVNRYNNALGGSLARLTGRAKMTIDYGQIAIKAVAHVSIGAVIGYFI